MRELRIADCGMTKSLSFSACLRFFCSVLSGVSLFASFSPLEWAPLAWIALVPLLILCAFSTPGESFKWGFLCGLVFWLLSISWVSYVTCVGWIALCLYCALYVACFSMTASWWIHRRGLKGSFGNPLVLLVIPALWVGFEFSRSTFGTGFPWNPLGVSQFNNLALIQCAQGGGVYLVSYMIALVNVAVALTVVQYCRVKGPRRYRPHPELIISLAVVAMSFWYGGRAMRRFQSTSGTIRIAAIQPNIPQMEKWSEDWVTEIYRRVRSITEKAVAHSHPDLVVWPETAVPDFVGYAGLTRLLVDDLLTNGVPILVGSM
ncbi:apolipoprotein N-acyltransferase, partial [Verrucomicrobiota bacterium]